MSTFPDDLTTEQDPDPDSPEPGRADHAVWISDDQHHFDHNIADARWAEALTASRKHCTSLADRMVRHLLTRRPQQNWIFLYSGQMISISPP